VLQDEAGMMLGGRVTELLIRDKAMGPADMTSARESKEVIRSALGSALGEDLDVFFWIEYMADYLGLEAMESGATKLISILLLLLAIIGISNTMLLAIMERTKETGMMRALGMTDGQIVMVYVLEAGFLGFIGSLMGIILGCLINIPMVKYGIDFSEMMEQMGGDMGFRVAGNFRGTWKIETIIGSGIIATVLSAFMAFLPTRRANKMAITESLRFE
jgi:ABC-type lipoprotein release transport system permease subunit